MEHGQMQCVLVGIRDEECRYISDLLRSIYGESVAFVEAESGTDGLIACIDHDIDFVFMHYHQRDFDALEFTDQLRHTGSLLIPIFLLVQPEHQQLAQHAVQCGADEFFVINEIDHKYFRRCVQGVVERYSLRRQLKVEQQKLQAARVIMDQAHQTRDEFLSTMSHEIRTPLNGIVGVAELMQHTDLSPEQMDYIQTIVTSSENLQHIIDDMLDYNKLESGKLVVENVPFRLRDTVEDAVESVIDRARTKGLELACLIYPNVPNAVVGDADRISQVLRNILSNAIKFTKDGVVGLDVFIESEATRRVELRFVISDTGIGLAKEQRNRIFKPFLQGESSSTRSYGGTGLGLSIARQLVEMMGGQIGIDSREGVGTNCWFTLPLQLREAEDFDADYDFTNKKVLIVDDNETALFVLSRQLEFLGMECIAVSSGIKVVELMEQAFDEQAPFDLALIDLNMPDPDGWILAQQIRRSPQVKDMPLILISSTPKQYHHEQALAAGYNACLSKPARDVVLQDTLAKALNGERELRTELIERKEETSRRIDRIGSMRAHVLLVEDNVVNQKVGMRMLRKLGCTVDLATNGQEAVDAVVNDPQRYQIVFMDCQMPIMDGYESTRVIRMHSDACAEIPIIALTANTMDGDKQLCLDAGMDDHLGKPIQLDDLYEVLDRWLRRAITNA